MSETRLQQEIIMWFNNEYPLYRGLLCYNNNNSTGSVRGVWNKFLGIIKGRSDLTFYFNGKAYMIELKTLKGRQSEVQKDWEKLIVRHGFTYIVVRSLQDFKIAIHKIINNLEY
jgi:hypothetical protein